MVKKTIYEHHPVQFKKGLYLGDNEQLLTVLAIDPQTVNLVAVAGTDDRLPWRVYNINELAVAAGITIPTGAVGALIDVEVNDAGSAGAAAFMSFVEAGAIYASKTWSVYCGNVNDRVGTKQLPIMWTEGGDFAYRVNATGAVFDYTIRIVGWIMAGSDYTYPEIPSQNLACGFRVNQ